MFPNVGFIVTIPVLTDIFGLSSPYTRRITTIIPICMSSNRPEESEEAGKTSMRTTTPDEERGIPGIRQCPSYLETILRSLSLSLASCFQSLFRGL